MFRVLYVGRENDAAKPDAEVARSPNEGVAVGFANSVDEALEQARTSDVVLISAKLPGDGALEIVRAVAGAQPHVRILVQDLAESRQPAIRFMEAGATGWLL
jgi:DNA-binding NarL/FixJ family response regulator